MTQREFCIMLIRELGFQKQRAIHIVQSNPIEKLEEAFSVFMQRIEGGVKISSKPSYFACILKDTEITSYRKSKQVYRDSEPGRRNLTLEETDTLLAKQQSWRRSTLETARAEFKKMRISIALGAK